MCNSILYLFRQTESAPLVAFLTAWFFPDHFRKLFGFGLASPSEESLILYLCLWNKYPINNKVFPHLLNGDSVPNPPEVYPPGDIRYLKKKRCFSLVCTAGSCIDKSVAYSSCPNFRHFMQLFPKRIYTV